MQSPSPEVPFNPAPPRWLDKCELDVMLSTFLAGQARLFYFAPVLQLDSSTILEIFRWAGLPVRNQLSLVTVEDVRRLSERMAEARQTLQATPAQPE